MNSWRTALWATAFLLWGLSAARPAELAKDDPEVLLEAAKHKALVDGDLEAAIEICEKIVAEHNGDRATAARALVHIGRCYEKLGNTEARKAYERVVREYADQPEAVSAARERLAALGRALGSTGDTRQRRLVVREVKIKPGERGLSLSRDGRKLVYPKSKDGKTNLAVRDLASGEETEIPCETGAACYAVFSPDGKEIAHTSFEDWRTHNIHVVSLETGEDRPLNHEGFPVDWSRDGRYLLVYGSSFQENEGPALCILPLRGGGVKKLNVPQPAWPGARFSPDAKYVSYPHQGKLHLYPVDGGDPIQITDGSPRDGQPIWSPDRNMLLFLSRRAFGPEADLCGVPVVDGKTASDVRIVKPDLGSVILLSLSETGRLLFRRHHVDSHVYVIPIDPQTGQPTGEPVRLADGYVSMWSPDGKRIAYISEKVLHVMSADGSNDQEIISVRPFVGTHTWAPDNDHIYVAEVPETGSGIYSISVSTKERQPVFLDPDMIGHVTCSPDGKQLAFLKLPASSSKKPEIFTVNVDRTNLEQLTSNEDGSVYYPAWSPDGKQIAFESGPRGGIKTLTVVSVNDGTTREVFRGETPQDRFWEASWSPDGSKIAWSTSSEIRIGQVSDGKYHTFKVDLGASPKPRLSMPHWSADGTKMLFSTWAHVGKLMLMEGFLPQAEEAK